VVVFERRPPKIDLHVDFRAKIEANLDFEPSRSPEVNRFGPCRRRRRKRGKRLARAVRIVGASTVVSGSSSSTVAQI
jgi:hypothetical protein